MKLLTPSICMTLHEVRVTPDEVKDGFHHICVPSPPPNGPEWLGELVGFFIK
jgi:hypothetical protein